jgi:hypothetical protein
LLTPKSSVVVVNVRGAVVAGRRAVPRSGDYLSHKIDHAGCHNLKRNLEERKQREETKEEGDGSLAIERQCSS